MLNDYFTTASFKICPNAPWFFFSPSLDILPLVALVEAGCNDLRE